MSARFLTRNDVVDLVSVAKVSAGHHQMTLAEAWDTVVGEIIARNLPLYRLPEEGVPTLLNGDARNLINEIRDRRWWAPDFDWEADWRQETPLDSLAITMVDGAYTFGPLSADDEPASWDAKPVPEPEQFTTHGQPAPSLPQGPTHARLMRAIASFPTRYPDYRTKPPKLDADVRPWLTEAGLAENVPEQRVFGAVLREHFQLSPDTQKTQ